VLPFHLKYYFSATKATSNIQVPICAVTGMDCIQSDGRKSRL